MRPPILCFANVKSCGNTPKINGALHMRYLFIFSVPYVHQACEYNCTTVLSKIIAVYTDWPLSSFLLACACSGFFNARGGFPLLQDPRRSSPSNFFFFAVMTLEKKLCVSNVWLFTEGKFYSIFNIKSSPKIGIEAFVCKRAPLSREVKCDGAPSRRQQWTKHFELNMKIDCCLLISA